MSGFWTALLMLLNCPEQCVLCANEDRTKGKSSAGCFYASLSEQLKCWLQSSPPFRNISHIHRETRISPLSPGCPNHKPHDNSPIACHSLCLSHNCPYRWIWAAGEKGGKWANRYKGTQVTLKKYPEKRMLGQPVEQKYIIANIQHVILPSHRAFKNMLNAASSVRHSCRCPYVISVCNYITLKNT